MNHKVKLILNPMANMGRAWKAAVDLRPIISEYGNADWSGTVYPTHATELARQAGLEGYDRVIAVGGDGTVHEVVNGLMQVPAGQRPVLGVVPIGSGNDFGHAIGASMKPGHALMQALHGEVSAVDIGLMTDETGRREYFNNTAGVGFDAVVTIRSHKLPLLRGVFMYLVATIETILLNHNPIRMEIEADGEKFEERALLLAACNSPREGGGFILAPSARIDDGILNFALIRFCSRPMMFRLLPVVMRGKHERFKQVRSGLFHTLSLKSDRPLYIHLDGEVYTSFNSNLRGVKFDILPGALQVVRGSPSFNTTSNVRQADSIS